DGCTRRNPVRNGQAGHPREGIPVLMRTLPRLSEPLYLCEIPGEPHDTVSSCISASGHKKAPATNVVAGAGPSVSLALVVVVPVGPQEAGGAPPPLPGVPPPQLERVVIVLPLVLVVPVSGGLISPENYLA